jgi:hypothetical protein
MKLQKNLPKNRVKKRTPSAQPKPLIHSCPEIREVNHVKGLSWKKKVIG